MAPTRALAEAIAAEWAEVPEKADINVSHLPLTRLAADRARPRDHASARGSSRTPPSTRASDMLCYRASEPGDSGEAPAGDLAAAARLGGRTLWRAAGRCRGPGASSRQPVDAVARAARWRSRRTAISACRRSTISRTFRGRWSCALAVAEGHLSAADAFAAAQLDELYQIERWGEDPIATKRACGHRARHRRQRAPSSRCWPSNG